MNTSGALKSAVDNEDDFLAISDSVWSFAQKSGAWWLFDAIASRMKKHSGLLLDEPCHVWRLCKGTGNLHRLTTSNRHDVVLVDEPVAVQHTTDADQFEFWVAYHSDFNRFVVMLPAEEEVRSVLIP